MDDIQMVIPCLMGVEGLVGDELRAMEARAVEAQNARVVFRGDEALLARANLWCRYGERVQVLLGTFRALSFEELFQGVRALPWERWIGRTDAFPVKGRCVGSKLSSLPDCQSIVKKAVVERLSGKYGIQWFEESGSLHQVQFLILKDQDSFFTTMANVVKAEDYEGFERCVDEAATEKARQRALDKGNLDLQGNPVYNKVFQKVPSLKKKCVVACEQTDVKNTMWNGSTVWRCFGIIFLKPVPLNAPFKNLCRTGAGITVSIIIPGAYRICSANGTMQRTSSLLPLTMPSIGSNSWI